MHREPLSYINQRVYADAVGPYSPGVKFRGETVWYWISIEDGFSRNLVTGPIKDVSAKTVAEAEAGIMDKCVFSSRENTHRSRRLFHSNSVSGSDETPWNQTHCDPSLFARG